MWSLRENRERETLAGKRHHFREEQTHNRFPTFEFSVLQWAKSRAAID
jgi:hypothetical protein